MDELETQAFTLTTEEVVALCDGLGLSPADVLRDDAPDGPEDPGDAVRRGLIARGIVMVDDERPVVDELIVRAFELAAQPALLARVTVEVDGSQGFVHLAADPEMAVERRLTGPGIHQWLVFPGEQVLTRVRELGGLESETPVPAVEPLTVPLKSLVAAGAFVESGDAGSAVAALTGAGASGPSATAYISALSANGRSYAVTVLYRQTETAVTGSLTSWLDAGDAGRWRLAPSDSGALVTELGAGDVDAMTTLVTLSPVSADEVLQEILDGLPSEPQASTS